MKINFSNTFVILLSFPFVAWSQQNLVFNPSFEDTVLCPCCTDQMDYSNGWARSLGSPDYYNACSAPNGLSVPSNFAGFQYAAAGNAYAGFVSWGGQAAGGGQKMREYIGGTLIDTMVVGVKYFISAKFNLCGTANYYTLNCASNNVGITFSSFQPTYPILSPITNSAKVYSNNIITDSVNWVTIAGSFFADSAYSHIQIGNFFSDANTDTLILNSNNNYYYAYYFVDDVCVSTDSLTCNQTLSTNAKEIPFENSAKVFPNPSADGFIFALSQNGKYNLIISDAAGKKVDEQTFTSAQFQYRNENIQRGIYFFQLTDEMNRIARGKIIVE
jgi:hypothetical protein